MSLEPGQTLASYEILALLGKGGMGEVYRARDANLDREVAIKVLPDIVADDEERVLRFQREARVLASLTHPHIGAIHGFESAGSTRFLVLEYVEGESLADRLARGPFSIESALETCRQIAEALEAAHEAGVIHRDLKPANVQLRSDGTVKVLDFGLARAMAEDSGESTVSDSPTITADFTKPGVVLGTASYMSPEQARGKRVDKRADIWAFGCCLYEALTGKQAFEGDTVTDLFANIIKGEPDWKCLPQETPWKVRELLERCLTKDPSLRLRDIGDARIELRRLSTETGSLTAAAHETTAPHRPRPLLRVGFAAAFLSVGAGLGAFLTDMLRAPVERAPRHLAVDLSPDVPREMLTAPRLSSDGSRLLFHSSGEDADPTWYLHDLESGDTIPAPGIPGEAGFAFLSWDGSRAGFLHDGRLWQTSLQGGSAQEVHADTDAIHLGASWGEDGTVFFIAGEPHDLYALGPGESAARLIYDGTAADTPSEIEPLPGGKAILLGVSAGPNADAVIGILDLESLEFTQLIEDANSPRYLSSGHLLFVKQTSLIATSFDPATREVGAERITIPTLGIEVGPYGIASYTVSRDEGALVYLPGGRLDLDNAMSGTTRIRWNDDDRPLLEELPMAFDMDISPDGQWLAISCVDTSLSQGTGLPRTEILRYELDNPGRPRARMASGILQVGLRFSPDSSKLAYSAGSDDDHDLFVIPVRQRQADPVPILRRKGMQLPTSWALDSSFLLFQETEGFVDTADIWKVRLDSSDPEPVLDSALHEADAVLSPDGSWLAFLGTLDGQDREDSDLYVESFPPAGLPIRITNTGATALQWDSRKDRLRLYFSRGSSQFGFTNAESMHAVTFSGSPDNLGWETEDLLPGGATVQRTARVAADGRILLMEVESSAGATQLPRSPEAGDRYIYVSNLRDLLRRSAGR